MEEDPLVTQRMRDIARTQMCDSHASAYNKCGGEHVNEPVFFIFCNNTFMYSWFT
jgi:hypothetical protein